MKRFMKIFCLSFIISAFCVIPAFAQEVTDPNKVIKEETFNAEMSLLEKDFHNMEVDRANNYLKYIDGVIYNLNETVRIKKEIVTNYKWLSQVNPYYETLIPAAEADLAKAEEWVEYYKQYKVTVTEDFKVRYGI